MIQVEPCTLPLGFVAWREGVNEQWAQCPWQAAALAARSDPMSERVKDDAIKAGCEYLEDAALNAPGLDAMVMREIAENLRTLRGERNKAERDLQLANVEIGDQRERLDTLAAERDELQSNLEHQHDLKLRALARAGQAETELAVERRSIRNYRDGMREVEAERDEQAAMLADTERRLVELRGQFEAMQREANKMAAEATAAEARAERAERERDLAQVDADVLRATAVDQRTKLAAAERERDEARREAERLREIARSAAVDIEQNDLEHAMPRAYQALSEAAFSASEQKENTR